MRKGFMTLKTVVGVVLSLFFVFIVAVFALTYFEGSPESLTHDVQATIVPSQKEAFASSLPDATMAVQDSVGIVLSSAEISKHSSRESCWLLISGKVYDVTPFIADHPGGSRDILKSCGTDATRDYETQDGEGEHSSQADAMLADYYIGDKDSVRK